MRHSETLSCAGKGLWEGRACQSPEEALPNHLKLAFETIVCQPEEHDGGLKHMASFVLPKTWASFLAAGL